jgi:hypothetical protein
VKRRITEERLESDLRLLSNESIRAERKKAEERHRRAEIGETKRNGTGKPRRNSVARPKKA